MPAPPSSSMDAHARARRPNRSAAQRRAQAIRAQARVVQSILRALQEVDAHRGQTTSVLGGALRRILAADGPPDAGIAAAPPAASPGHPPSSSSLRADAQCFVPADAAAPAVGAAAQREQPVAAAEPDRTVAAEQRVPWLPLSGAPRPTEATTMPVPTQLPQTLGPAAATATDAPLAGAGEAKPLPCRRARAVCRCAVLHGHLHGFDPGPSVDASPALPLDAQLASLEAEVKRLQEVQRSAVAAELAAQSAPARCPTCSTALEWTDYVEGNYAGGGWECNNSATCGRDSASAGPFRWFCSDCENDFCKECFSAGKC